MKPSRTLPTSEVKRRPKKPGEVRTLSSKPRLPKEETQERQPDQRPGKIRKASPQPEEATQAPPSANKPGRKSKVEGRRSSQDAKAHRTTKAESQSSKLRVTQGNCVVSPNKREES